jgi:lysophospholipase L1-like esterase
MSRSMNVPESRFDQWPRHKRAALIAGVIAGMAIGGLIMAEGAVRLRALWKHGSGAFKIEDTFRSDPQTGLRLPIPGVHSGRITINSLGFRGPEISVAKPPHGMRIAFLGGSTTYCAEVSSDAATWPQLVTEQVRRAHPELLVDYINAGVPGYTLNDSKRRFELQVAPLAPDLVVIYHATNDLSRNSRDIALSQGVLKEWGDHSLSRLAEWSMLVYLVEKNLNIIMQKAQADEPTGKIKLDLTSLARPFEEDLRALVTAVKRSGARVALATFSTRLRRDQSPEVRTAAAAGARYYMPFITPDDLLEAYESYNDVIRSVAATEAVQLLDVAAAIPADATHFVDSVHFTDAGAARMAEAVWRELVIDGAAPRR